MTWLGDCGGLRDGVFWIGSVIISTFSSYSMKNLLLTTLFRIIPSNKNPDSDANYDLNKRNKSEKKMADAAL